VVSVERGTLLAPTKEREMDPYDDPFSIERTVMDMKMDFYTRQAIRDPRAQMVVANIPEPPRFGMRVVESDLFGDCEGAFLLDELFSGSFGLPRATSGDKLLVVPKYNRYGERTGVQALKPSPLYAKWTLGAREARRARRRQRKGLR
jgi:hypothetical protein